MSRKKSILKLIKSHEIAFRYMRSCKQSYKSKGLDDCMFNLEKKKKHIEKLRTIKNNHKKQTRNIMRTKKRRLLNMNNDKLDEIEFHKKVIKYYEKLYAQGKILKDTLDIQTQDSRDILESSYNSRKI